jgi:proline dehydrogenase
VLRRSLLVLAGSQNVKRAVSTLPGTSGIVARFVAGESVEDAVSTSKTLVADGLQVSLDHLGEDTTDVASATATTDAYLMLLRRLDEASLTGSVEVSVKLSAVGQALPDDGERIAVENAHQICTAAAKAGTTVTIDMEDHRTTDATLAAVAELRADFPTVGAVLQAYLHRTEEDCRTLAYEGSRVRLCKGAYNEPAEVAFQDRHEVDKSYVRCLKALMAGQGYPMVATHDPRLIRIAGAFATRFDRAPGTYEFQMLYGIRSDEQKRLAGVGERVRVYVPYGEEWYGYLMRRLAERPSNLTFFLRSLLSQK